MMPGHKTHRWLWAAMGLAAIAVLVVLFQPAFSSETPASPAATAHTKQVIALAGSTEAVDVEQLSAGPAGTEQAEEVLVAVQGPPSDNCIACHTNQALLQELAEEPEVVESAMASGEG